MSFLFLILAATFSGIGANPIANELNNNSELESSAVNSVLWSKTPKIASSVDSPISPVLKCDSDNSLYGNVDDSVQKRSGMCPWTGRTGSAEQSNAPAETPKKARVTSESPCAGSPLLNYLSCGGGRLRISLYYGGGISYVLNCVPAVATIIPARELFDETTDIQEYCCETYDDTDKHYPGYVCVKLKRKHWPRSIKKEQVRQFLEDLYQKEREAQDD